MEPLFSYFKTCAIVRDKKECHEVCSGHETLYEAQNCMEHCSGEMAKLLAASKALGINMEFRIMRIDMVECEGEEYYRK